MLAHASVAFQARTSVEMLGESQVWVSACRVTHCPGRDGRGIPANGAISHKSAGLLPALFTLLLSLICPIREPGWSEASQAASCAEAWKVAFHELDCSLWTWVDNAFP